MTIGRLWRNFSGNFVQTLTGFVYLFLLPKFIEECNGLPLDEAADSTRCTELCARTARVSQQCLTRTLRK